MNFFKFIATQLQDGQRLSLTVLKTGENLTASVSVDTSAVKDPAIKNNITPMAMSGTPDDFEDGFEAAFAPVKQALGLVADVEAAEKAVEEAKSKSQALKAQQSKEKDEKKAFADLLALADKLLKENKFKDARAVLDKAETMPQADKKKIETLRKQVKDKAGEDSLFGGVEDMSDGKALAALNIEDEDDAEEETEEEQED